MGKVFRITGSCIEDENYMVDITDRLAEIAAMVDKGQYFVINRARQFGKTTTLHHLKKYLAEKYTVWSVSFEGLSAESFADEDVFVKDFLEDVLLPELSEKDFEAAELIESFGSRPGKTRITKLGTLLKKLCALYSGKLVLIIDEVDQACNNQVFIDFLGILRRMYLGRAAGTEAFQSVILASVYDIKNMKIKIRPDSDHRYNSPWNIAEPFRVEMFFSEKDILFMLEKYEKDHSFGMDIHWFSRKIYEYTSGYPFLVSYICKLIDEVVWKEKPFQTREKAWTQEGFQRAVKLVLALESPLFDDMIKKLQDYPRLKSITEDILLQGMEIPVNPDNQMLQRGFAFGLFAEKEGKAVIANRIFETRIYNWLISEITDTNPIFKYGDAEKGSFVKGRTLDLDLILERFRIHYDSLYSEKEQGFLEREGRFLFLTFLKPIINGTGNYYVEAQTRDQKRTDVIIDYLGKQYIIELKIWHGEKYQEQGRQQLCEYLDIYGQKTGWLVSFCFNKTKKKESLKIHREYGKIIRELVI